jgi:hypothetical protein
VIGTDGGRDVRTVEGVQPGDVVRINFRESPVIPPATVGSFQTTFPAPLAGGTTHVTTNGCNSITSSVTSTTPNVLNVFSTCTDANGNGERLAQLFDGQGTLLGYHYLAGQPVTVGTPTQTPVDAWNTSLSNISCQVTDVPAGIAEIEMSWNARIGILNVTPFNDLIIAPTAGSTITRTTEVPGDAAVSSVGCSILIGDDRQCRGVSTPPGTFVFSGSQFTSTLSNLTIDQTTPRFVVDWDDAEDGAVPDFTSLSLRFNRNNTPQTWSIVSPGTATQVTLPELPSNGEWVLYQIDDQALAGSTIFSGLKFVDPKTYEEIKGSVGQTIVDPVCASTVFGN